MTILSPRRKMAGYRCQAVFQISGLITPLCLSLCGYEITYPKRCGTIALSAPDYPEKRENARTNIRAIRMP